jgi:tetratricopeptide (TPR) repeat protein
MKKSSKAGENKATAEARPDAKGQADLFAQAMKLFNSGDFRSARPLLEKAAQGPKISVNETALMYMRMCDKRIAQPEPVLKTADDYYTYGVGLMNDRRPVEALKHLEKALTLDAKAPHIYYAHALAAGLSNDVESAVASLRKALELDPSTRAQARSDSDFHPLLQHAAIRELLVAERAESA